MCRTIRESQQPAIFLQNRFTSCTVSPLVAVLYHVIVRQEILSESAAPRGRKNTLIADLTHSKYIRIHRNLCSPTAVRRNSVFLHCNDYVRLCHGGLLLSFRVSFSNVTQGHRWYSARTSALHIKYPSARFPDVHGHQAQLPPPPPPPSLPLTSQAGCSPPHITVV